MSEQILSRIPLFATLPEAERQHLAALLHPATFPPQAVIFQEDNIESHFYILVEGQVEIIKALGSSNERLLGVRNPITLIGEMSLFSQAGRATASVRALTPVEVLEMARAEFDALLRRQPAIAYELVRTLSVRLHESEDLTIRDLKHKNQQLTEAYEQLKAAQAQIVENEKLKRELEIAREIQLSVLPSAMPQLQGFDFGALMLPAQFVGGDFYDLIPLGGDQLGIVVGDVSGKGVPAALFMTLTYSLMRAETVRADTPREAVLTVNRHLLNLNTPEMFVTLLYGVLNCATREFYYVRAGHPPPMLLDAEGKTSEMRRSRGQPLGVFAHPELDEQHFTLPVGGAALVYSDGVPEAADAAEALFGNERLSAVLRAHPKAPAQALCQQVQAALKEFSGSAAQYDDVTLVAIRAVY